MKEKLMNTPVMIIPKSYVKMIVHMDVCGIGFGGSSDAKIVGYSRMQVGS